MRKIIVLPTLLVLLTLLVSGCKKYLDIKPYGQTIPKTAEEFSALLHTILYAVDVGDVNKYALIGNKSSVIDWDMYGDDFEHSLTKGTSSGLRIYIGEKIQSIPRTTLNEYQVLMGHIRDCNIVLGNMEERDTDLARNVIGTAHAIRAVSYYNLMRLFCEPPVAGQMSSQLGLPIVKEFNVEAQIPRSTLQEVVDFIESELKTSMKYEVSDKIWRFTTDVVRGYLARLYFWTQQWDKAIEVSESLLQKYPILEGEAYKEAMKSGEAKENILIRGDLGTAQASETVISITARPLSYRYVHLFPKEERANDIRYQLNVDKKWLCTKPPIPGMRTDELVFITAESYYHLGKSTEALKTINDYRLKRVSGAIPFQINDLPAPPAFELIKVDATGKPITPLLSLILTERRKEMLLEADRFFELKRNGRPEFWVSFNTLKYTTQQFMYTLPIPPRDVVLQGDDLKQNPEYDKYLFISD